MAALAPEPIVRALMSHSSEDANRTPKVTNMIPSTTQQVLYFKYSISRLRPLLPSEFKSPLNSPRPSGPFPSSPESKVRSTVAPPRRFRPDVTSRSGQVRPVTVGQDTERGTEASRERRAAEGSVGVAQKGWSYRQGSASCRATGQTPFQPVSSGIKWLWLCRRW